MKELGLFVLSLAVFSLVWLFARSIFRWIYAFTACEVRNAQTDLIAVGVLLAGALLVLLNGMVLL